jgi:uncharacterized protein involved in outer membrane biogenesis
LATAAAILALVAGVALGEWAGWPFLAGPLQRQMASSLERNVRLSDIDGKTRVRFIGRLRVETPFLEIGAPAWSQTPHMLQARDVALELRYIDLWRARQGQALRVQRLHASTLDGHLERLKGGRASWQFGAQPLADTEAAPPPVLHDLRVKSGTLRYRDELLATELLARMSLAEGIERPEFKLSATGHYRKLPVKIQLVSAGVLPWVADERPAVPVALALEASVGRASLSFKGSAVDALRLGGLAGDFSLQGPSLAAVGDPLGVTLPTTAAFRSRGSLRHEGQVWNVAVADAKVGSSRLRGAFTFDTTAAVPKLSGRLNGSKLMLVDLGPVVGTTSAVPAAAVAASAPEAAASAPRVLAAKTAARGKLLPDRPFDLPALRAMNADVQIDIAEVDLNTSWLQPLRPLRARLQLDGGVLTIDALDARTAEGRLGGELQLDGRGAVALWSTQLRWSGVRLERWLRQPREGEAPPYVTGQLGGRADLKGRGRSTADILGSLQGSLRTELRDGTVSHQLVEAAGLDLAESLGLMIKGDDALPIACAVADLSAEGGTFKPRLMVLDTSDSALWVDGVLSLASETMDLRVVVRPKDFSPITLRAPLRVHGSFAAPEVSLDKRRIAGKLGASLLLALVNPAAALIPLIDLGDAEAPAKGPSGCAALAQRHAASVAAAKDAKKP